MNAIAITVDEFGRDISLKNQFKQKINTLAITVDEFGRDTSLKKQNKAETLSTRDKFKGMKWSDICDEIEEEIEKMCLEQEQKQKSEDRIKFRKITNERKQLLKCGLYELEEGEILE
jgi:hypothetical protein